LIASFGDEITFPFSSSDSRSSGKLRAGSWPGARKTPAMDEAASAGLPASNLKNERLLPS
jgi:hypothetical protein